MNSIEINIIDPFKESRRNNLNNYFDHMCAITGYEPITTFWDDFTIADKYGAVIIEDAAESLGATYKGKQTGSFGDYSIISFKLGKKIINFLLN